MIISYESSECYTFTDDKGTPYPALRTKGCGCCSSYLPVTQENINQAILEAEKWLETLKFEDILIEDYVHHSVIKYAMVA